MSLVNTPCGQIRGVTSASGIQVFKGIRFANAERLQPPVLVTSWSGVLDALEIGPECPQTESQLRVLLNAGTLDQSEDCLFLNITCPQVETSPRPVYVWIHGGGFTNITPPLSWSDSEQLSIDGDAVVVTIAYRLGAFGFLGNLNLGVLDQIAALQWLKNNIAAFGGDPTNITIFGESAGGCSVVALMASPLASGLFAHAWAMSPSLGQLRSVQTASNALQLFLTAANASSLSQLRAMPTEDFLKAQETMLQDSDTWIQGFSPTADGVILPHDIVAAAAKNPIDLVIGTTQDESRIFNLLNPALNNLDVRQALQVLRNKHKEKAEQIWSVYTSCYRKYTPSQIVAAIDTDTHFKFFMWKLLRLRPLHLINTWSYTFSWKTPIFEGVFGASHGIDIPFIFNNTTMPRVHIYTGNGQTHTSLGVEMSQALLSLGRSSHPNWQPYDQAKRTTKIFDVPSSIVGSDSDSPENILYNFWMTT